MTRVFIIKDPPGRSQSRHIFLWINCLLTFSAFSQDAVFSQFYDQPLLRNPALAGIFTGDMRLTASYRNQWQSVTIPYRTFGLSMEVKLPVNMVPDDNLTIGLQLFKDVAGTSEFSAVQILPAINYSLPLSRETNSYLSIAFMGGFLEQQFDPARLILNDQFVAFGNGSFSILPTSRQVLNNTNMNYLDLSAGLSFNSTLRDDIDYYVGTGLFHITSPEAGFFDGNKIIRNKKLAFNGGLSIPVNEEDQLTLYGDYFRQYDHRFESAGMSVSQFGVLYTHDWYDVDDDRTALTLGLLYRMSDAVIPVIRMELSQFVIGASYDVNISQLVVASRHRGGFELTLSYRGFFHNYSERRQVLCPRFGKCLPREQFMGY